MKELNKYPTLDESKLWIGNIDPTVTDALNFYWYQLLKLVQTYGTIEKFDLIFHRSGPLTGQPRGYAFVSYARKEDAVKAKNNFDGELIGQRKLIVTWAHTAKLDTASNPKPMPDIAIPALALSQDFRKPDAVTQIQAIEAKLKSMEQKGDELKINESIATKPPVIQQYQFNKDRKNSLKAKPFSSRIHDRQRKPYIKKKPKH